MVKFTSVICKLGINPVVDPPDEVLHAIFEQVGRSKGPIRVRGLIDGAEYIQTLVKYSGRWRLYINGEMLKASGLKVGDTATIEIEYDPRPRVFEMRKVLRAALAADKKAKAAFDALTPSRRTEIICYLGSLKTEVSIKQNVEKVLKRLLVG